MCTFHVSEPFPAVIRRTGAPVVLDAAEAPAFIVTRAHALEVQVINTVAVASSAVNAFSTTPSQAPTAIRLHSMEHECSIDTLTFIVEVLEPAWA